MKRIAGWRASSWPIPGPLQEIVRLVPYRDPEAYLDGRRAAREAAKERRAIQDEGRKRGQRTRQVSSPPPAPDIDLLPPLDLDQPVRAAVGWYRIGVTFYRIGEGPTPSFALAPAPRPPATHQGLLF